MSDDKINIDKLWNALRTVSCATKPAEKAKCIVMLTKNKLKEAIDFYNKNL